MSHPIVPRSRRAGVELRKKPHVKLTEEWIDHGFRRGPTTIIHHKYLEAIARIVPTRQCAQTDSHLLCSLNR